MLTAKFFLSEHDIVSEKICSKIGKYSFSSSLKRGVRLMTQCAWFSHVSKSRSPWSIKSCSNQLVWIKLEHSIKTVLYVNDLCTKGLSL